MENPKATKRPRQVPCVSSSTSQNPNPNSLSLNVPDFNQNHVDLIISSFLSLPDLPSLSSSLFIGCSFDRALEKLIGDDDDLFVTEGVTNRSLQLASLLHDSAKRCYRKRITLHNSYSWYLPNELTLKVFSMLDTKSLMQASACCTMFNKSAMDPLCYSHIDLTTSDPKDVDDRKLHIMIDRAGKELRSVKLGSISSSDKSWLTRTCLAPLYLNDGLAGGHLRSLHLYNLKSMDCKSLCDALSACSNLTDLKILGLWNVWLYPLEELGLLTRNCRLIKHLFLEHYSEIDQPLAHTSTLVEFVDNCPNLTSLTLKRFGVNDEIARTIITGFRQLKYANLSESSGINGSFLRDLGLSCKDSPLETLILRNCNTLKEREVSMFLNSLITGDFKSIRYIDVSSINGLVSDGGNTTYEPKFLIEELKKQRPNVTFVATFESPPSSYISSPSSSSSSSSSDCEDEIFGGWPWYQYKRRSVK